jgi:hypothetical protein
MDESAQVAMDPMVEAVQDTEELNLKRILSTATKVAVEKGTVSSTPVNSSTMRQRNLLLGVVIFVSTLVLGMMIGKRTKN